jgi:predicted ABC-type sugar transport system permease subunit
LGIWFCAGPVGPTYSISGNLQATVFSGVSVPRYLIYLHGQRFGGGCRGAVRASASGADSLEEASATSDSIAAVVIGGTSLFGGEEIFSPRWLAR